ncbi:MAG: Vps62-related protein [Gaiellaceae bacterium]
MAPVKRLVAISLGALALVPASDGAQVASPSLATLLARHVPILVLHPAERFQPVPVAGFLADADLQRKTPTGWEKVSGPLPAGGADLRLDQRLCRAIEGMAAAPCYAQSEAAHGKAPVVYGATFRVKDRILLQYWLWYPYNDYSSTLPPGEVWQVHEGDWESVSVILDRNARPLFVGLSKHCAGTRRDWANVSRQGARPIVYVALGSHANYFGAGTYRHSPTCWPPELRDVVRALELVDRTEAGRRLRPKLVQVTSTRPSWMRFAGLWGEDGYLHFPNNDPRAYRGSPLSPPLQDQWRSPVKEESSWPRG